MNLEQRVLIVEQELQILKTQIQVTLLNIQEHLLNNKYPTLRANDSLPAVPSVTNAQPSAAGSNVVKRVAATESNFQNNTIAENKPPRAELRQEVPSSPKSMIAEPEESDQRYQTSDARPAFDEPKDTARRFQAADVRLWIELDKWVNQKVKEVGIEPTRELIGLFEGPEQQLLMQVLDIYDNGIAPAPSLRTPAMSRPAPVPQTHAVAEEWQKHANATKARNATYRPFGEHQELALRLIAEILNAEQAAPVSAISNGHPKH